MVTTRFGGYRLGGSNSAPAPDVIALLLIVFVTYSLKEFVPGLELLRLSPLAWRELWVFQIVTYAWVGFGRPSLWFLLELFILYWFVSDIFRLLRRRRFWTLFLMATVVGGLVAIAVDALLFLGASREAAPSLSSPFVLLQGQRTLLLIAITSFSVLRGGATIMLFFVLPVMARWFVWIELAVLFIGFLDSRDLAGFLGGASVIGITVIWLRYGGFRRFFKESRLRVDRWRIERRLGARRKKSGLTVVKGVRGREQAKPSPWIH